jgi:hypothetical protein
VYARSAHDDLDHGGDLEVAVDEEEYARDVTNSAVQIGEHPRRLIRGDKHLHARDERARDRDVERIEVVITARVGARRPDDAGRVREGEDHAAESDE